MAGYARALVGVDGSPGATMAAERAIDLAVRCGMELHLVDVVRVPEVGIAVGTAGAEAIVMRLVADDHRASDALQAARRRAAEHGVDAIAHLVHGDPHRAIAVTVVEIGADLIVIGSRGLDDAGRHVLGSVPDSVLRRAGCDVLVVHSG